MATIVRFQVGLEEFSLNDAVSVWFNPTDMSFIDRVFTALDELDGKEAAYHEDVSKLENDADAFQLAREHDAEIREQINSVFGVDVCTPCFGGMNAFALSDGLPVWANLLLAVIDTMDSAFTEEKKKTNPRIAKYTAKYNRNKK